MLEKQSFTIPLNPPFIKGEEKEIPFLKMGHRGLQEIRTITLDPSFIKGE
jgi:hypothetical protein